MSSSSFNQNQCLADNLGINNAYTKGQGFMSELTEITNSIHKISPELALRLQEYNRKEASRRKYGLVFEPHSSEVFEVQSQAPCKDDLVVIRSERGSIQDNGTDQYLVDKVYTLDGKKVADIRPLLDGLEDIQGIDLDRLIKTVSQQDVIFPGLIPDGEVIGDPDNNSYHSVICTENYDGLRMLGGTDLIGKLDCIYIDPPYNTGNKDWIYNNDYVDGSDEFRSSAFLNFLEKRLQEAKTLLNPEDSVLILTIDEKEYLNVGVLLRQVFSGAKITMVSSVINSAGVPRKNTLYRTSEYIYIVQLGESTVSPVALSSQWSNSKTEKKDYSIHWSPLRRSGTNVSRTHSPGCFYPFYVDEDGKIVKIGDALGKDTPRDDVEQIAGAAPILPVLSNGEDGCWQQAPANARKLLEKGYIKVNEKKNGDFSIYYLKKGEWKKLEEGIFPIVGREELNNTVITEASEQKRTFVPGEVWNISSHNASAYGTNIVNKLHGEKRFDFPKSLHAVEDVLRFFIKDKPNATVLDFFGGSGTTAHAVMRLNTQDGGHRRSITMTNNEVGVKKSKELSKKSLQSGDTDWEKFGVYQYATKPRITAAITGKTAASDFTEDIKGCYRYNDLQEEYAIGEPIPDAKAKKFSEGLKQNVKFFTLEYLKKMDISLDMADDKLYPLLWLEQGQQGDLPDLSTGYFIGHNYAVISDISKINTVLGRLTENINTIYVHGDSDTAAQVGKSAGKDVTVSPLWDLYINRMKAKTTK